MSHRTLPKRKLTKFILEAIKSYSASQLKMVQLEYFVKFHGRSYWNCAWISGAVLYAIHPSIVRNYIRSKGIFRVDIEVEWKPQEIESLDFADKRPVPPANHPSFLEEPSGSKSLPVTKIEESTAADSKSNSSSSITIQHTSEEEIDNEDSLDHWTEAHTENIQKWVSSKVENVGSRRRYLIRWGVEREQLIPEQIISIGDAVNPTFDGTGDADSYLTNKETSKALQSIGYREVLVAWFHLPRNQATWEIVEEDLEALDSIALHLSRAPGLTVRDSTGRKLLPLTVRRHLIQLTNTYCTRIARMLCDAYSSYATIGKRPGPNSESWDNIWKDGQPSYLSPSEHAALHPYQVEGVRWLWHAFHNHVNAILADEMGLGKTVQVIALLYLLWKERNDYGPFLIVAPLSTLLNWEREFNVWAPDFHVIVYSGERSVRTAFQDYEFRIPNSGGVPAFHVLITSHELACIERSCLQSFDWSVLVVDEAHRLKNKQSRLFKEASQYKASFKILLTGTPLQNNLEELFHLLYFVEPKTVTDFKTLTEKWAHMPKEERINSLHCQLKNHLLRRLKADVIRDLPKKSEISVMVDMSVLQRKLYKLVLTKNYEELRCGSLMNSLVHLQKVCNHPYLLPVGDAIAPRVVSDTADASYEPRALVQVSGKMIVLMEMLRGLRERGHRVLVYSRMTTMLDILEEALTNEGYAFERIDGRVKGPLRQIAIDRFNARDCETFIFLLSTRAGGEGINLASADTVILYDSDWNPQCDLQALSRAHRIGQSRHVLVYRFITRHSLEERINLVARRKLALTNLVVNQRQQRIQEKLARQSTQESALDPNSSTSEEPADRCATSAPQVLDDGSCSKEDTRSSLPPITSTSNRLSRAEMDDMLRCGLETLFAVEDLLDVNDLQNAARSSDNPEHIVYDAQAISRLLDRSKIEADSDDPKSVADEYLSVFRVAHFGTPSEDKGQDISGIEPGDGSSATADHSASAPFVEVAEDKARPAKDTLGYAAFWDRLLRERHERLCNAEAEAVSENPRRVSKASWRLLQRTTLNSPIGSDDEVVIECEDSSSKGHSSSAIGPVSGNLSSRISDTSAENSSVNEDGCNRPSKSTNRQRNSHRSLKSKRTKAARHSTSHGASKRDRACESRATDEDTFIASDNSQVSDELNDSDVDPSYVPSNEDSDDARLDASLVAKWQRRNRNRTDHEFLEISDSDETDSPLSIEELTAFGNICNDTGTAAFWHPIPEVCAKWREAADSSGPKIEWANDCMFIHGFGPEDRQSFANAVMRFGLPPPGVIPPQDWLPPNLLFKDPARLHAYSTLFMQHLFEDPNAMDDSTEYWSDGLPKEQLCASAVLARIGMMALIRNKVLQFEDINGVHSRTFEAVSTRFKFNIHEGGLTLLRPTWYDEWQRINALVEKIAPSSDGTDFAMKKRSEAMYYLQHTWHSRHDYWLLAAIHVHGYFRWADILADPRFHLLNTGLEGVLADMEGQTQPTGGDSQKHQINMAEAQAFLVNRLRLLEHALLVEQALHEIAQAALEGSSGKKSPPLTRVQNLVVCLSNKLAAAGPRKRIALPRDERARSATRAAVERLQEILEDIYADLPGLPASVLCAEAEPASTSEQTETTTTQPSNASSEMSHKEATTSLDSAPETAAHTSSPSPSGAPSDVTSDVPAPSPTHPTDSVKPPPPSPDKMTVIEISDSES
ncbi:unnamed protein product [Dicrocoelium dendriticum]|nr:unnamed protein product [Dicrocoelium dendriticum]